MIVGLTGKKGAGKDMIGSYLIEQHGFVRVSFADALKESVAALFDIPVEQLETWKNDPHAIVSIGIAVEEGWMVGGRTMTVRQFLQRYGTEAHREVFGDGFWLDVARQRIAELHAQGHQRLVFTDVRFDNEAELIRTLGGQVVRIWRPEAEVSDDSHASEQLPQADYAIVNDRSPEYAFHQARRYIIDGVPIGYTESDPWAGVCGSHNIEEQS